MIAYSDKTVTAFKNPGSSGWNQGGQCKVMAVRSGNDFAVATSQIGDTSTYVSTLNVTLSSDARLQKFSGPAAYGFSAYSQANSKFTNIKFTTILGSIYDIPNDDVWDLDLNSGSYTINSAKSIADLGRGLLIYAPNKKCLYYVSPSGSFDALASSASGGSAGSTIVKRTVTINAGSYAEYFPSTEFGTTVDPVTVITSVRVKDTTSGSPTQNMMINAEAVSTVAYTGTSIRVYNDYSTSLVFDIVLKR
jgi:hypothetical protein